MTLLNSEFQSKWRGRVKWRWSAGLDRRRCSNQSRRVESGVKTPTYLHEPMHDMSMCRTFSKCICNYYGRHHARLHKSWSRKGWNEGKSWLKISTNSPVGSPEAQTTLPSRVRKDCCDCSDGPPTCMNSPLTYMPPPMSEDDATRLPCAVLEREAWDLARSVAWFCIQYIRPHLAGRIDNSHTTAARHQAIEWSSLAISKRIDSNPVEMYLQR